MSNLINTLSGITNFSSIARIDTVNNIHWFQGNVGIGNTTPAHELDVTGNISAQNIFGTIATGAQSNITSVGILNGLTVDGNGILVNTITAPYKATNGVYICNLSFTTPTDNRTITFPNASVTVNAAADLSGNTLASGITASSLTSLGTLSGLNMGGNILMNNNSITGGNTVSATTLTGTLSTAAQGNVTSLGTLTSLIVGSTGITVNGIATPYKISNGTFSTTLTFTDPTSNRTITFPNASITVNAASDLSGNTLASGVTASSLTSIGTLSTLNMGGNIVMNNNSITGGDTISATTLAGTLSTAAQGNITSLGTLTSLTVGSTGITVNGIATPYKISNGSFSTTLAFTDPTSNRTITFPNASVTVNAAADLSGNTLASGVTASSLTSLGTLSALNMGGNITMNNNSITGGDTLSATTLTGTLSTATQGNITSLGTLTALTVGSTGITVNGIATPYKISNGTFSTTLAFTNPTADCTITFPNASITVNAAADLSGNTLASGVTASSLTSVGTLTSLTTSGNIVCGNHFRGPGTNFYSFTSNGGTVGDLFINSGGGSSKFVSIRSNGDGSNNNAVEFDATNTRVLFRNTAGTGYACFHSSNSTVNFSSSVGTAQTERLYVGQDNFIVAKFKREGISGRACNILFENSNGTSITNQCAIGIDASNSNFVISPGYTVRYNISEHILPAADGTQNLGSESFRFANTFAVNGYNTSKMAVGVNTTQTEPLYVEGNNFTICKLKRSGGTGGGAQIMFENSSGTGTANQCQIGVQGTNNDFLISPATTARWRFNADLLPEGNGTQNIGSSSRRIGNIVALNTPKIWASFTLFGGVYTLKSGFGISSVTYNSTSNFTINFSTAFADTNYCWVASAGFTNTINQQNWVSSPSGSSTWKATGSLTLVAVYQNNLTPNNNATDINVVIFSL